MKTYDAHLETHELISSEEFLSRRKSGELNPNDVEIVTPGLGQRGFGGFRVKLKVPRYSVSSLKQEPIRAF